MNGWKKIKKEIGGIHLTNMLNFLEKIKTPKLLCPIAGNLLFKREKPKAMVFPIGTGLMPEQEPLTKRKLKALTAVGGNLLNTTTMSRLKMGQPLFREPGEVGKIAPILPSLAPKEFIGDPKKKLDMITNVVLGLPEATFKTLPFIKLLREPAPATLSSRAKAIGNEAIDFVRGMATLVIRPGISVISLLKDEPIERQVKNIPFLGDIPTYERTAYEMLMMGTSPLEVGITLGAEAAITAGILGQPAVRATQILKPKIVTKTSKIELNWQDISEITRGAEVNPQNLKAFKQAVSEGIEIGKALRAKKPVLVKMKTPNAIGEILYKPVGKKLFERIIPKAAQPVPGQKGLPGLVPVEPTPRFAPGLRIEKMKPVGREIIKPKIPETPIKPFEGLPELTTKTVEKLKGKTIVSKQYIFDLSNASELKQAERDLIRKVLGEMPEGKINVKEFSDRVKTELLSLTAEGTTGFEKLTGKFVIPGSRYEGITLPDELRGSVANYGERIYESPIKTSAGEIHFPDEFTSNYFAHTRIEDLPLEGVKIDLSAMPNLTEASKGNIRRVIEIQSDLFQKGGLGREASDIGKGAGYLEARAEEITKLQPYRNTWWERIIREEIKRAAKDGKTKLQFPTGETAMKIEGLGDTTEAWISRSTKKHLTDPDGIKYSSMNNPLAEIKEDLFVGMDIRNRNGDTDWIITDVLGDGKFKAYPERFEQSPMLQDRFTEQFDISGKVDISNPIYRFYEKEVQRYLKRINPKTKLITDNQGVTWYEVPVTKAEAEAPITAYKKVEPTELIKFNITKKEAEKSLRKFFNEEEVGFLTTKRMIRTKEGEAYGEYADALIKVVEKAGMISDKVLYHEAFHAYFDLFIPKAQKTELLDAVIKKHRGTEVFNSYAETYGKEYGKVGISFKASKIKAENKIAEELLAEGFGNYQRTKTAFDEKIAIFYRKLLARIKGWIGKKDKVMDMYKDIVAKKRPTKVIISEKGPPMYKKKPKVKLRLLNRLNRLKYPKIPAEQKSVRRAIEAGKISPEFEGKTITEMRKIKGFTNPKSVPTERLSIFENFINLNKIKRKNVPYKQMGIAEIIRGDKVFPAIRQQSGFYALKEIQTAPIRDIYSQLLSPYHMAMRQDSYKLGGKFGIMFQKIWKPTEKAIRGEKEFSSIYFRTIKDIGKRHKIKTTGKNLEHLSDVIEKKVKATPQEELFIRDIRNVLDDLRNQANLVRRKMRKKEMGYITDYIPHIQKTTLWNELLSNVATISDNLDFIIPNAVRNPFTYKRMMEEMPNAERNLYILLDRYVRAISKDIYITPAIENIKAYNAVLKNRELFNTSKYWDEYIRVGLIGKQHKLDSALSIGQTGRKGLQRWNDMVNKAFLTGKVAWNIATQPLSYIMNVPMETGVKNSIIAVLKNRNKSLRQFVKKNSNVLAIKSGDVKAIAIGEGRNIQNRIYQTKIDKYNDFISMIGSIAERELTLTSYIAGLQRAKDLGYKGQDALDFADLTAARTQSMYNRENRALILDSDMARTLFPFQSFSVEMFNHLKEIGTKGGAERLNARQRTGKLFRLLFGLYLANLYSQIFTGRKKTTIGTFFPFVGNYVDMLIAQATNQSYYGGRSPITVIQIGSDIIKGSKDFIEYGDIKKLRKVGVNFGLALGGIGGGGQINNIIDGLMADINEEVKNVKGNTMFRVEDTLSKIIAPIFGIWATREGREYFEPKEEKKEIKTIKSRSRLNIKIKGKSRLK